MRLRAQKKSTGWTALTIAFLLAGSGLATAQTERVITARELQQFNPQTIEAITRETVSDRPASATAQRDAALVLASPQNLRFNAQSESFVGDIFVQLRDLKAPDAIKEIGTKIGIVISAEVDEITPASLLEINLSLYT